MLVSRFIFFSWTKHFKDHKYSIQCKRRRRRYSCQNQCESYVHSRVNIDNWIFIERKTSFNFQTLNSNKLSIFTAKFWVSFWINKHDSLFLSNKVSLSIKFNYLYLRVNVLMTYTGVGSYIVWVPAKNVCLHIKPFDIFLYMWWMQHITQ